MPTLSKKFVMGSLALAVMLSMGVCVAHCAVGPKASHDCCASQSASDASTQHGSDSSSDELCSMTTLTGPNLLSIEGASEASLLTSSLAVFAGTPEALADPNQFTNFNYAHWQETHKSTGYLSLIHHIYFELG